jgi:hypothetical protein
MLLLGVGLLGFALISVFRAGPADSDRRWRGCPAGSASTSTAATDGYE